MKNLLKTTVCFTTMSLTAILLPMNVMANEGEAKTITIAWTNIMESQQEIWEKYIFEPFEEKHPEVTIDFQCLPDLQNTVRVQVAAGAGPDMFYMDSVDIPDYASTREFDSWISEKSTCRSHKTCFFCVKFLVFIYCILLQCVVKYNKGGILHASYYIEI